MLVCSVAMCAVMWLGKSYLAAALTSSRVVQQQLQQVLPFVVATIIRGLVGWGCEGGGCGLTTLASLSPDQVSFEGMVCGCWCVDSRTRPNTPANLLYFSSRHRSCCCCPLCFCLDACMMTQWTVRLPF